MRYTFAEPATVPYTLMPPMPPWPAVSGPTTSRSRLIPAVICRPSWMMPYTLFTTSPAVNATTLRTYSGRPRRITWATPRMR